MRDGGEEPHKGCDPTIIGDGGKQQSAEMASRKLQTSATRKQGSDDWWTALGKELVRIGIRDPRPGPRPPSRRQAGVLTEIGARRSETARYNGRNQKAFAPTFMPILVRAIRHRFPAPNQVTAKTVSYSPSTSEMVSLKRHGLHYQHIEMWADFLTTEDPRAAVAQFIACLRAHPDLVLPTGVFHQFLRRSHISASALHLLVEHVWAPMAGFIRPAHSATSYLTSFRTFALLTGHARQAAPSALPRLAELLVRDYTSITQDCPEDRDDVRILSRYMNRALDLLSKPASYGPFENMRFNDAALKRVLTFMSDFQPPLIVGRQGYQAVIRVQAGQQKTGRDRQWADLKALSWPPWKRDRLGTDADITPDQGISRAGGTLRQMYAAGFARSDWESLASVYTGWDTDHTPTIQWRTILKRRLSKPERIGELWGARVATTRTAQEAWSCYEASQDAGVGDDKVLIHAMVKKLSEEEKRLRLGPLVYRQRTADERETLYPGDIPNIDPPPPSTHLETPTRTPVPTVDSFLRSLRARGVGFLDDTVAIAVASATSRQAGLDHLRTLLHPAHEAQVLVDAPASGRYSKITANLICAYIILHCRFPDNFRKEKDEASLHLLGPAHPSSAIEYTFETNNDVVHCICIVLRTNPALGPAWQVVLKALGKEELHHKLNLAARVKGQSSFPHGRGVGAINALRLLKQVVALMRKHSVRFTGESLIYASRVIENAVICYWRDMCCETFRNRITKGDSGHIYVTACAIYEMENFLPPEQHRVMLEGLLDEVFGNGPGTRGYGQHGTDNTSAPVLLHTPSLVSIHAYIRALGWLASYDALHEFVCWVAIHNRSITIRAQSERSGKAMMRRVIVAVRVFLERSWITGPLWSGNSGITFQRAWARHLAEPAPDHIIDGVRETINNIDGWGGWPSDQEVHAYCDSKHAKKRFDWTIPNSKQAK